MTVYTAPGPPAFAQDYPSDCGGTSLAADKYCVDGDLGFVRFGTTPPAPVSVDLRRFRKIQQPGPPTFGGLVPSAEELTNDIRSHNLEHYSWYSLPPSNPSSTIREWARAMTTNPVSTNYLVRYGQEFSGASLFSLLKGDPSFDVQGQWFAAASYGLLQLIPEDHRKKLEQDFSPSDQQFLKATFYDPMFESPVKLFDPDICIPMGAAEDVKVPLLLLERDDTTCAAQFTQCTWERMWRRRFCMFNTGLEYDGLCPYAQKIMYGSPGHPGAESFVPQP